jgi:hypothetical protein
MPTDEQLTKEQRFDAAIDYVAKMELAMKKMKQDMDRMLEINTGLQDQLDQQAPAQLRQILDRPSNSRLPDKFSGNNRNDSVENFKTRLSMYFLINKRLFPTPEDKVLFIIQNLEGPAYAYVESFLSKYGTNEAHPMFAGHHNLITELTKVFGLPDQKGTYEQKLDNLKQFGDIVNYITLFRTYAAPLGWPEEPLLYHFKKGLSQDTRNEMRRFPRVETLEDNINTAIEAYRSIQMSKNERNYYHRPAYQPQPQRQQHQAPKETGPQPMDWEANTIKYQPLSEEERS